MLFGFLWVRLSLLCVAVSASVCAMCWAAFPGPSRVSAHRSWVVFFLWKLGWIAFSYGVIVAIFCEKRYFAEATTKQSAADTTANRTTILQRQQKNKINLRRVQAISVQNEAHNRSISRNIHTTAAVGQAPPVSSAGAAVAPSSSLPPSLLHLSSAALFVTVYHLLRPRSVASFLRQLSITLCYTVLVPSWSWILLGTSSKIFDPWMILVAFILSHVMTMGVLMPVIRRRVASGGGAAVVAASSAASSSTSSSSFDPVEYFFFSLGLLVPLVQLSASLTFGYYFGSFKPWQQVLGCSLYPLGIGLFVGVLILCTSYHQQEYHFREGVEIVTKTLAGLPYRIVFLALSEWPVFLAVLGVEIVYKICAYPLRFSSLGYAAFDALESLKLKLGLKGIKGFETEELIGYTEEEKEEVAAAAAMAVTRAAQAFALNPRVTPKHEELPSPPPPPPPPSPPQTAAPPSDAASVAAASLDVRDENRLNLAEGEESIGLQQPLVRVHLGAQPAQSDAAEREDDAPRPAAVAVNIRINAGENDASITPAASATSSSAAPVAGRFFSAVRAAAPTLTRTSSVTLSPAARRHLSTLSSTIDLSVKFYVHHVVDMMSLVAVWLFMVYQRRQFSPDVSGDGPETDAGVGFNRTQMLQGFSAHQWEQLMLHYLVGLAVTTTVGIIAKPLCQWVIRRTAISVEKITSPTQLLERTAAFSPLLNSASLLVEHLVLFFFLLLFTLISVSLVVDAGLLPTTKFSL